MPMRSVRSSPLPGFYVPPDLTGPPVEIPHPTIPKQTSSGYEKRELLLPGVDDGPRAIAYGEQKLAGKLQFVYYREAQDEIWMVIELCAGECDGFIELKFSDGRSTPSSTYLEKWWYAGTALGQVDSNLAAVLPSWNEALPGTCYGIVRLKKFGSYWKGEIPDLVWRFRARKCVLPEGGAATYSTSVWDQWHDFVRWNEGKKLPASRVDSASFEDARDADIAGSIKHSSNLLLMQDQNPDDVIQTFRLVARAYWFWEGNKFRVVADRAGSSVATYDDSHISKAVQPDLTRANFEDRPDKVTVWYTDRWNGWVPKPYSYPETDPPGDIVEETFHLEHLLYNKAQTKELAVYLYKARQYDGRIRERWQESTSSRLLGDIVTRDIESRGISMTARILRRSKNPDNTYDVELFQHDNDKFTTSAIDDSAKIASTLPDPAAPPPAPSGLTLTEVAGNLQVSWTAANDYVFYKHTRVTVERTEEGVMKSWVLGEVKAGPLTISPLETNAGYVVRAVSVNLFDIDSSEVSATFGGATPPEVADIVISTTNDGGNYLTSAKLSFSAAQTLSTTRYGPEYWSNEPRFLVPSGATSFKPPVRAQEYGGFGHDRGGWGTQLGAWGRQLGGALGNSGGSLRGFVGGRIDDNENVLPCFTAAVDSVLRFHAQRGRKFRELRIVVSDTSALDDIRYSSGGKWRKFTQTLRRPSDVALTSPTRTMRVLRWDEATLVTDIAISFSGPAVVYDVHLCEYSEYSEVREYRLYVGNDPATRVLACPPIPKVARPTAENPLDVLPYGITGLMFENFSIAVVSAAGFESAGAGRVIFGIAAPAGDPVADTHLPQLGPTVVELSATPASNINVALAHGVGIVKFTVASGTGATVHGFRAMPKVIFPWFNGTGGDLVFKHESATETTAANRIVTEIAGDLTVPSNACGWAMYDDIADRLLVFAVAAGVPWETVAHGDVTWADTGAGTWTVDSGDLESFAMWEDNKNRRLHIHIALRQSTISSTVTELLITYPASFPTANRWRCTFPVYVDVGGTRQLVNGYIGSGNRQLVIGRDANAAFSTGTGNVYLVIDAVIPI